MAFFCTSNRRVIGYLAAVLCALLLLPLHAAARVQETAEMMRRHAQALIEASPAAARAQLVYALSLERRTDWHYTPRSRDGIAWKDMTAAQRSAALELLRAPLSAPGLRKVQDIMLLEKVLRELENFSSGRDSENYAFAVYGDPRPARAFGWRIEGHHLSLHFSVDEQSRLSTLPQFFGANPARVSTSVPGAPTAGTRLLGEEEDRAFALLESLDAGQRQRAVISAAPYGDVVSRNAAKASPLASAGLSAAALSAAQQAQLLALVSVFAQHLKPALAERRLRRVNAELQSLEFAWAGSQTRGKPHYFRIQGPSFLIEYDNSGGNHVHTVWRDFAGDFGQDFLREHYQQKR